MNGLKHSRGHIVLIHGVLFREANTDHSDR